MVLEVLGSGGSITTPKIFCSCPVCREGRERGGKYTRSGPSVFIHGPDILIDTPEEISVQINRSDITDIKACFYSHWHPDHTAGRRLFLSGEDLINEPPRHRCTPVYLTETLTDTFDRAMGILDHFKFMEQQGVVKLKKIRNDEKVSLNGYKIKPVQLGQEFVFGYVISGDTKKILVLMDELKGWQPSDELIDTPFDIVYLPFGIFSYNPVTKEKVYPEDYFLYEEEATIKETLEVIRLLKGKQFILSHIEEMDGITLDLAESLEQHYSERTGKSIKIAWDGMKITI